MQYVKAASATISNGLKDSLSGQRNDRDVLPCILKTPESAALVSDIGQQPTCDMMEAIAGEKQRRCKHVH